MFSRRLPIQNLESLAYSEIALVLARVSSLNISTADSCLTAAEKSAREHFATQKRRNEFGLGRLIAKHSVGVMRNDVCLADLEILPDAYSRPVINHSDLKVSIAHSENMVAAICFPVQYAIGIDIEDIKVDNSNAAISAVRGDEKTALVRWTAIESIYKAGGDPSPKLLELKQINSWTYQSQWECADQSLPFRKTFSTLSWIISDQVCSLAVPSDLRLSPIADNAEAVAGML